MKWYHAFEKPVRKTYCLVWVPGDNSAYSAYYDGERWLQEDDYSGSIPGDCVELDVIEPGTWFSHWCYCDEVTPPEVKP